MTPGAGGAAVTHGWKPETGFLEYRTRGDGWHGWQA